MRCFVILLCFLFTNIGTLQCEYASSFYSSDHLVKDISGKTVSLDIYDGKVSLVVNVASECGFTDKHYNGLVRMQRILGKHGRFNVLAFPCNQFGGQEPQSNSAIEKFAKSQYEVNFPMFAKINVIERDIPAAWSFLTELTGSEPNWNFWKYLVDHHGQVLQAWGPWNDVEEIFEEVKRAVDVAKEELGDSDAGHDFGTGNIQHEDL